MLKTNKTKQTMSKRKIRYYKTLEGLLTACRSLGKYVRASDFFDAEGGLLCSMWRGNDYVEWYAQPSPELRAKIARELENWHWRKSNPARLEALANGRWADFSCLKYFYIGKNYYGNSMSGDVYEQCKRKFTKSAQ